ncbi:hypothetical protein Tco_0116240 [Tanacetum coccineum]
MSTLVFVDPESSTQADGAQSSRVPVPLPEDPYEAIRQAYLDGTDTESEPFEDPIDTETPESPLAIAPPVPLSESTPPVLVPILRRTARMAVRVPHAMSSGLSASLAEVAAMSESALRKRFRSSCESSPSVSPPDLPLRKRYHGTSELVEDSEEEDEEIEESMDSYSVSEDAEDEGPTAKDEDPTAEDEGLTVFGRRALQATPIVGMTMSAPLGLWYGALRCQELALEEGDVYSDVPPAPPVQTPPSPEWTSATPTIVEAGGFLTELGAQVEIQVGLIRDHAVRLEELSPALFERSLEYEQKRVAVTFRVIWRLVLALKVWAGQMDAQRAALWHAISDVQGENRDLRLQLVEERRARLELSEVIDGMRRGQEPKRGV